LELAEAAINAAAAKLHLLGRCLTGIELV
jgi:hypothetical protein